MNQETCQRRLAEELEQSAALNLFAEITDPVAWQREQRQDRPVAGRSGGKEDEENGKN